MIRLDEGFAQPDCRWALRVIRRGPEAESYKVCEIHNRILAPSPAFGPYCPEGRIVPAQEEEVTP